MKQTRNIFAFTHLIIGFIRLAAWNLEAQYTERKFRDDASFEVLRERQLITPHPGSYSGLKQSSCL